MAATISGIEGGGVSSGFSSEIENAGADDVLLPRNSEVYSLHLVRMSSSFTNRLPEASLQKVDDGV